MRRKKILSPARFNFGVQILIQPLMMKLQLRLESVFCPQWTESYHHGMERLEPLKTCDKKSYPQFASLR